MTARVGNGDNTPEPTPVVVADYGTYPEAHAALDQLLAAGVAESKVSLVWSRLRQVESPTTRRSTAAAALEGALAGASAGGLAAILISLFVRLQEGASIVGVVVTWTLAFAALGAGWRVVTDQLHRARHDLAGVGELAAESYQVWVDEDVAGQATARLSRHAAPTEVVGRRKPGRSAARAKVHATAGSLLASPPPAPPVEPGDPQPA